MDAQMTDHKVKHIKPSTPSRSTNYRPSPSAICQTRILLTNHLRLPTELDSMIFDLAHYWTTSVCTETDGRFTSSTPILRTPPLGTTHSGVMNAWSGKLDLRVPVRGERPARSIRVTWKGEFTLESKLRSRIRLRQYHNPKGTPVLAIAVIRRREDRWWEKWPPECEKWDLEVMIGDVTQASESGGREVVFGWGDGGIGGDLVRGIKVGDCLEVRTGSKTAVREFDLVKLEIEVASAI